MTPPFDYVPASQAAYDEHLGALASEVANDLHGPDILLVQEAEDQDICTVASGALACGSTDNADGKPDTLQELALRIAALGGPAYDAAYDRDGADDRGIVAAFLYRTDRVQLLPARGGRPGARLDAERVVPRQRRSRTTPTSRTPRRSTPTSLPMSTPRRAWTGRTSSRGLPRSGISACGGTVSDWARGSTSTRSRTTSRPGRTPASGSARSRRRTCAAIVAALQAADPGARVDAGGDLNVFPRPDDPLVPASDQLAALYELGLENLFDTLVAQVPASAYTYVFEGQAQTLDHQFVTPRLGGELERARVAHVNADWPADFTGDGPRGASDHDPLVARYDLPATLAQLQALLDYYEQQGLVERDDGGPAVEAPRPGRREARPGEHRRVPLAARGVRRADA